MADIKLTQDATLFNSVCNHEKVFSKVSWIEHKLDIQPLLDRGEGYVIECGEYGGFFLHRSDFSRYIIHTAFLPDTPRGLPLESAKEALWLFFMSTDCQHLSSSACDSNPAAKRLMRMCGFKEDFQSPSRFNKSLKESFYSLSIDDYIRSSEDCKKLGEEFHLIVEETTNHEDDDVHDQYAGAAIALIRGGNYLKAEQVYNRWALLAGYEPMYVDEIDKLVEVGNLEISLSNDMKYIEEVLCR